MDEPAEEASYQVPCVASTTSLATVKLSRAVLRTNQSPEDWEDDGSADVAATKHARAALAKAVVSVAIEAANEEMFDRTRRQFRLSDAIARRLGVGDGDLVEITTGKGAPVRGWTRIGGGGPALSVGSSTLALVCASPGDTVVVRAARPIPEM